MRTPPDMRSKCRVCGKLLGYEIGSIAWQCRDDDLCGFDKCYNEPIKDVADRILRDFQKTGVVKKEDLNRVFGKTPTTLEKGIV